jgi:hypothetical protein
VQHQDDVTPAGQLTFDSPAAFDAWRRDLVAAQAAKIDPERERAWLVAEAEKPESDESKRRPGIVALADRRRELDDIPDSERTAAQQWELDSLEDVKAYEEAFPRFFEAGRKTLRHESGTTSARRSIRKPSRAPHTAQRRPREHRGSSRVARARPPSASDDPHEQPKPGNRANVVTCVDEILVLFVEQHSDRVSATCSYCGETKRGTRLTLLGDGDHRVGWWRGHLCVGVAVAA